MAKTTKAESMQRFEIPFFEGVNNLVADNLSKKEELKHAENARSRNIGTIEKRQGTSVIGNSITATNNYGLFFFENDVSTVSGIYRISTVSGVTSVYYLNGSAVWTALTGFGTGILELGDNTTQFDITNTAGSTFRYTYDTNGTDPDIDHHIKIGTIVVTNAQNFSAGNNGTFTVTGVSTNYFEVTNAGGVVEANKTIGTGSITITGNKFSHTIAEENLFLVNGDNDNMQVSGDDGTTVSTSASSSGHLYNSPKARKINYFKERLYLADYTNSGGTRYKNGVMMSSRPLGIVALVDGDHDQPVTSLKVTDLKYIRASDSLDIYRGGTKIGTATVTAKNADTNTITINAFGTDIKSSDEVWVANTYEGTRLFRWADYPASGIDVLQYDTFKVAGGQNDRVTMMTNVGDWMVISNRYNFSIWDGTSLRNLDNGIGCVSDRGYTKVFGALFFLGYKGIYQMAEGSPEFISSKVQRYIDGATKSGLESGAMGVKGTSIFCSIGDVTLYNTDGSEDKTLSSVVLEKNLKTQNWYIHTGISATQFNTYVESSNPDRLLYSSTDTKYPIFEFLTGTLDDEGGDDKEIPFRIDSGNISPLKESERYLSPQKIIIDIERGSGMTCFVSLDDDPFYELQGDLVKGCSVITVTGKDGDVSSPPRCRKINISIRDYSKQLCKISKVVLLFKALNEEEQENIS